MRNKLDGFNPCCNFVELLDADEAFEPIRSLATVQWMKNIEVYYYTQLKKIYYSFSENYSKHPPLITGYNMVFILEIHESTEKCYILGRKFFEYFTINSHNRRDTYWSVLKKNDTRVIIRQDIVPNIKIFLCCRQAPCFELKKILSYDTIVTLQPDDET